MRRTGFPLIELLLVISAFASALLIAERFGKKYGVLGTILGIPLGFFGFCLGVFLYAIIFISVIEIVTGTFKDLPKCRNGKCKSGLFALDGDYTMEIGKDNIAYHRCKCGDLYKRDRKKNRVYTVHPDGTYELYKVARPLIGWVNPPSQR